MLPRAGAPLLAPQRSFPGRRRISPAPRLRRVASPSLFPSSAALLPQARGRLDFSICSPTDASFHDGGEPELALPVVNLIYLAVNLVHEDGPRQILHLAAGSASPPTLSTSRQSGVFHLLGHTLIVFVLALLSLADQPMAARRLMELYEPNPSEPYGTVLSSDIPVCILWYGRFTASQKAIVSDFIMSLEDRAKMPCSIFW